MVAKFRPFAVHSHFIVLPGCSFLVFLLLFPFMPCSLSLFFKLLPSVHTCLMGGSSAWRVTSLLAPLIACPSHCLLSRASPRWGVCGVAVHVPSREGVSQCMRNEISLCHAAFWASLPFLTSYRRAFGLFFETRSLTLTPAPTLTRTPAAAASTPQPNCAATLYLLTCCLPLFLLILYSCSYFYSNFPLFLLTVYSRSYFSSNSYSYSYSYSTLNRTFTLLLLLSL